MLPGYQHLDTIFWLGSSNPWYSGLIKTQFGAGCLLSWLKKYSFLRCTLDCTEVFIDRPRHMELQAQTWSDYKRHNTAKYLVVTAPNRMISFLSAGWGGRASDKHIVNESGFLNLVDSGDVILADRGFTINSELLMRGAKLEIPPTSSGI